MAGNLQDMWPYHPELLDKPVPRYTSYPTAAEFSDTISARDYEMALNVLPDGAGRSLTNGSLYVHIPFCKDICSYCGCNTGRAGRRERLASYVDALETEISSLAALAGGAIRLSRISFGGGSPNALDPADFLRILDHILTSFCTDDLTISVELDPRSFDQGWADALQQARVTRASLGVQTLAPHVQQAIGRIQPLTMITDAVTRLRDAGITSLNFDLMYGLPLQSADDLTDTIDHVLMLAPDRIALFGYAHVPHLVPRQRQIDATALPGPEARFAAAAAGHRQLTAAGMTAIGFDHFARPSDPLAIAAGKGLLQRNFQGFTDDQANVLLGVGASAISQFPGLIVQNEKNSGRYRMRALAGQLPTVRGTRRDDDDQLRGQLITDLLCGRPADLRGLSFDGHALRPFVDAALCIFDGPTLRIADRGRPYARAIAACFDRYRQQPPERFSSAI